MPTSRKSRRKPSVPEDKRTTEVAEHTVSKMKGEEAPEIKVETPKPTNPDRYLAKKKLGTPTIGRSANYVTKVGLGNLEVKTAHGNIDV